MIRHPNKEIAEAVAEAVAAGWRVEKCPPRAHCWAVLYCPAGERGACKFSVYGTPRVPENEARKIRRALRMCPHTPPADTSGNVPGVSVPSRP